MLLFYVRKVIYCMCFKKYFIDFLQISMPAKYVRKPVKVEELYFQWDGQKFISEWTDFKAKGIIMVV